MAMTNAYGELNPLYPSYEDKEIELDELMRFFKFSYKPSSEYSGTGVFEIVDKDKTYYMTIKADPENGVSAFRDVANNNDGEISFHCTLPYDTFHDVFWGEMTCKTLVMGGGCKIKNWAYRAAFNFGMSFDMTSTKWVQYYQSGNSIKKMMMTNQAIQAIQGIDNVNAMRNTQRIQLYDYKSIGSTIPKSPKDTEFMYEWEPIMDIIDNDDNKRMYKWDIWRNKQRNMIKINNMTHISLWDNCIESLDIYNKMERYRENLRFNPLIIGKSMAEKWKYKIKRGSSMFMERTMDEYYGWYSQYTRNRIGAISLSFINNSFNKFTSLIHKQTAENEVAHFSLLNTMF